MSNETQHIPPRNRRFLVSIWLSDPGLRASEQIISGVIWTADPAEAGQIDPGARFDSLSDIPGLMEHLISPALEGNASDEAAR